MSKSTNDPLHFGQRLRSPEFDILSLDELRDLIGKINDKSLKWEERDDAKNRLLLAHARLIYGKVFSMTGGRIGIDDCQTELFDSAAGYIKERLSEIAIVGEKGFGYLNKAVMIRLGGWANDKIRRSDGKSLKRGKGQTISSGDALMADVPSHDQGVDDELIREETLSIIKANVFEAVAKLDDLEQSVVMCRFGLQKGDELTETEIADLLGQSRVDVQNAYRRAKDKLKKWLADHDPDVVSEPE